MKYILPFLAFLSVLAISATENVTHAQINNKPFSFNTPGGGVGMSMGGRQAILNKEIFGETPDNMVRSSGGLLLRITKGNGDSAIVSYEDGSFIPSFRGRSFRGDNESWAAGVFNTFFEPHNSDSHPSSSVLHTGAVISTWTGRVASDMPVSYMPANSVDSWTGMVIQASY